MKSHSQLDLGNLHVHKKAIADIVSAAVIELDGVRLIPNEFKDNLLELVGIKNYSGIIVEVDEENQVTVEVRLCVRYGLNIPDVATQVQDVVRAAVERTADINLKDIHVSIEGIERGE